MRSASLVTVRFLALVAVVHLARIILRIEVTVEGTVVPQWPSLLAFLMTVALAVWLLRSERR
jgi:hypothetical protein